MFIEAGGFSPSRDGGSFVSSVDRSLPAHNADGTSGLQPTRVPCREPRGLRPRPERKSTAASRPRTRLTLHRRSEPEASGVNVVAKPERQCRYRFWKFAIRPMWVPVACDHRWGGPGSCDRRAAHRPSSQLLRVGTPHRDPVMASRGPQSASLRPRALAGIDGH
jgi:hypothetical protein